MCFPAPGCACVAQSLLTPGRQLRDEFTMDAAKFNAATLRVTSAQRSYTLFLFSDAVLVGKCVSVGGGCCSAPKYSGRLWKLASTTFTSVAPAGAGAGGKDGLSRPGRYPVFMTTASGTYGDDDDDGASRRVH